MIRSGQICRRACHLAATAAARSRAENRRRSGTSARRVGHARQRSSLVGPGAQDEASETDCPHRARQEGVGSLTYVAVAGWLVAAVACWAWWVARANYVQQALGWLTAEATRTVEALASLSEPPLRSQPTSREERLEALVNCEHPGTGCTLPPPHTGAHAACSCRECGAVRRGPFEPWVRPRRITALTADHDGTDPEKSPGQP